MSGVVDIASARYAFGMSIKENFKINPASFKIIDSNLLLFLKNAETDAGELWEMGKAAEVLPKAVNNYQSMARS